MPRLKPREERTKMKLHSLSELASTIAVPEEAFKTMEVPEGAFEPKLKRGQSPYPVYMRYIEVHSSDKPVRQYMRLTVVSGVLKSVFKKLESRDRFEIVQGKAPHKDWFMIRRPIVNKGNQFIGGSLNYNLSEFNTNKVAKDKAYPLEYLAKDGNLYIKLPAELVPALR